MIRLAKTEDLNNITDVYSYARKFMAENGNPTQWPRYLQRQSTVSTL